MRWVGGREQPWQRWWSAEGVEPRTHSGVLADPADQYGHWLAPGLSTLADHDEIRCLVLLGEPGSGKSHELVADQARWKDGEVAVLSLHLGSSLWADALLTGPVTEAWRGGSGELIAYLDGFDEAQQTMSATADDLLIRLRQLPWIASGCASPVDRRHGRRGSPMG